MRKMAKLGTKKPEANSDPDAADSAQNKMLKSAEQNPNDDPPTPEARAALLNCGPDSHFGSSYKLHGPAALLRRPSASSSVVHDFVEVIEQPFCPPPPDGGYGWMVVCSAFICNMMFSAKRIAIGLFIPELTAFFAVPQAEMAVIASVDNSVVSLVGKYRIPPPPSKPPLFFISRRELIVVQ